LRLVLLVLTFAAVCLAQIRNLHTAAEDIAAGARIFRSHCADCYGIAGQGGKGPYLTTGQFFHDSSDAMLLKNISDGMDGKAMPGVFVSDDQVWQIIPFVRTLGSKG
jgi:mono/diheme cytochrome c family protein